MSRFSGLGFAGREALGPGSTLLFFIALGAACAAGGSPRKTVEGTGGMGGLAGNAGGGGTGNIVIGSDGGNSPPAPVTWPYVDPSLSPDVTGRFGGTPSSSGGPELVYPL